MMDPPIDAGVNIFSIHRQFRHCKSQRLPFYKANQVNTTEVEETNNVSAGGAGGVLISDTEKKLQVRSFPKTTFLVAISLFLFLAHSSHKVQALLRVAIDHRTAELKSDAAASVQQSSLTPKVPDLARMNLRGVGSKTGFIEDPDSFLLDATKSLDTKQFWIHFVGDSDTRGLVLALLRFLHKPLQIASTKEEFAKGLGCSESNLTDHVQCWSGCGFTPLTEMSRIHHIDYQVGFDKRSIIVSHCDIGHDQMNVSLNYRYRVTYEFTYAYKYSPAVSYWNMNVKNNGKSPDVFYLNQGAWLYAWLNTQCPTQPKSPEELHQDMSQLMELNSTSNVIYGTSLHWRNHSFDDVVKATVVHDGEHHQDLLLFDRNEFSEIAFHDLQLERDNWHAPTILNMFDAQRLLTLIQSHFLNGVVEKYNRYIPTFWRECFRTPTTNDDYIGTWTQPCAFTP